MDDGSVDDEGEPDPLRLIIEIKGRREEDDKFKKTTMENYWVRGVNRLGSFGRWAFAEFTDVYALRDDLEAEIKANLEDTVARSVRTTASAVS